MRTGHATAVLRCALAALLVAACTNSNDDAATSTPAPTTTATPATTPAAPAAASTPPDSRSPATTERPPATTAPSPAQTAGATGRYVDLVFDAVEVARDQPYASAPSLETGADEQLLADVYQPAGDTLTARPVIVVIHGGGFRDGDKGRQSDLATAYAKRGYVTVAIDYRLDDENGCQNPVQRAAGDGPSAGCARAILAAQHDAQAAVRWLRADAATWRIDPDRIAVLGLSAGAVTADNLAYRSTDPGDEGDATAQPSSVQAAISLSGCEYRTADIDAGDAPVLFVHAGGDPLVPFACAEATAAAASAAGLVAETMFYPDEDLHAGTLYRAHQADIDARWCAFLVDQLHLPT